MAITTRKFDGFVRNIMDFAAFKSKDSSLNGLQVDNDGSEFGKIAFAVDAGLEVFKRAADAGAGLLFVHHGLFWETQLSLTGSHRERLKFLLDHNLALYAVHLPLDQHPEMGNNAVLSELLGIQDKEPFGGYNMPKLGYKGKLKTALSTEEAAQKISYMNRPPLGIFPFGKKENLNVAVVSGGAAKMAFEALDEGIDLYISGEASHSVYHHALEGRLNIIAGGHYSTEVWGVRRLMEECTKQLSVDVEFIDIPTGL